MAVHVLIADPDEYLSRCYHDYLEQRGFHVTTVTTGLACVEKLRGAKWDVLVIDPSLPWGGGDGVLAMMNEESGIPGIPVIVLTDARDRSVLYRMAPFRIDDFQTKPLSSKRVAQRILAVQLRRLMEVTHETTPR
jgi:two-component system, OmpR family, response regulator